MRTRKTFYNRLTTKYSLVIRNEENFAEKTSLSYSYGRVFLVGFVSFFILLFIALLLARGILSQWFDPRYAQLQTEEQILDIYQQLDSITDELRKKDQLINDFNILLSGSDTVFSEVQYFGVLPEENQVDELNQEVNFADYESLEAEFRKGFEEDDPLLKLSLDEVNATELRETFFFSPLVGIVSSPYQPQSGHYGVDVVAKPNEPVKCVADGTVILADWTQKAGYVIAVQHQGDVISVYKHNDELLKKVGNFVSAGDVISIVGNTGELTDGPHLHFEIWFKGNPVDPEEFVTF